MNAFPKRVLRLLCSCDRYNYGDLLFPIVTRLALAEVEGLGDRFECEQYGLVRSDLSQFGALPSRGIADLYGDAQSGDVILLAGGENLAQTWHVMLLTLLDEDAAARVGAARKYLGDGFAEWLSRRWLGGRHQFPYIPSADAFHIRVRVMYNSVGGWPLRHYAPADQAAIVHDLSEAAFVSVRDDETASIIRDLDPRAAIQVAPDCVFLLSDFFPKDSLEAKASPGARKLVIDSGEYICFQCHPRYGEVNRDELRRELLDLSARTGMNVVLIPIGRIHSFRDDLFLESFAAELGDSVRMFPSAGIYDVAFVLASARLFCGTSLHGVITSLTYDVPFVPLATDDPKLRNNVASWGLSTEFPQAPVTGLAATGVRSLEVDSGKLQAHAARLRGAARANMRSLAECIRST